MVEYLGSENFRNLEVPTFGNRGILRWKAVVPNNATGSL